MESSASKPDLSDQPDFKERIRLLEDVKEKRSKVFERYPRYFLLVFSFPLLVTAIYGFFTVQDYDWQEDRFYWILIGILSITGLISGLLIPAYPRAIVCLFISLFAILCHNLGYYKFYTADSITTNILLGMFYYVDFWYVELAGAVLLLAILYALVVLLAELPGSRKILMVSIVVGSAALLYTFYLLTRDVYRFPEPTKLVPFINVYLGAVLIFNYFTRNNQIKKIVLKSSKMIVIFILAGLILYRPYAIYLGFRCNWFTITMWKTAIDLPILISIVAFADFLGQIVFRKWKKKADIELSRMKQEIEEF